MHALRQYYFGGGGDVLKSIFDFVNNGIRQQTACTLRANAWNFWGVAVWIKRRRVVVRGNHAARDKRSVLRADYVLFYKTNIPLVVVEAKDNNHAVGAGMAQAINYAELLNIPFSISSNGDGFVFRDATMADGVLETHLALDQFAQCLVEKQSTTTV